MSIFDKRKINKVAKNEGFIKRKRKLTGFQFLVSLVFGLISTKTPSLASIIDSAEIKVTRQSLHEHFSQRAVSFLQKVLIHIQQLCISEKIDSELLRHFSKVLVCDSSWWKVHDKLCLLFPGFKGIAGKTLCKLQLCYDFLKGQIESFAITKGTENDASYSSKLLKRINKRDLILVDLGFFSCKFFSKINQIGAYFVSRLRTEFTILDVVHQKEINLVKILRKIKCTRFEAQVILYSKKNKHKVQCRLICEKVPTQVAEQRRRKRREISRRKGNNVKKNTLFLYGWTLMITNVPQEILPAEKVLDLYKVRWHIELVIKQLKSTLNIDRVTTKNKYRLLCEIYATLIAAMVITKIHGSLNFNMIVKKKQEISLEKFFKRIQERVFMLLHSLLRSVERATCFLFKEIKTCLKNCIKLKQHTKLTTLERLNSLCGSTFKRIDLLNLVPLT